MQKDKIRVVITGLSTINPLGDNLEDYYTNLINGKSGIKRWTSIDLSRVECKIGGDLGDYDIKEALERLRGQIPEEKHKILRKLFRTCTFSNKITVLTAIQAMLDCGLKEIRGDPFRTSVLVAGHNFNSRYITKNNEQFQEEPAFIDPLFGVEALDPNIAATISEVLGARGPTFTVGGACASGNLALRDGFRDIITGESDCSIVSGAIFDMTPADIHAMAFLNSVVIDPDLQKSPESASRPFDTKRCGFVPSHGAGTIVLEELERARKRGARIYAELLGVSANANANHLPAPSSESQAKLITHLLSRTGVKPDQIDYVNCHATGTPLGDLEEIKAIKTVFGKHAYKMKLNAPKSMLGHVCWSAPIVETIGGILQMKHGKLHPSINIDKLDPEIDLDVCANEAKPFQIHYMLKNSFGFGGLNCCSLIKRYEE
ncbi:MAG: beta-ketoacyl-[acyl-carrier-protein] synthase family protein [Spirochaetes bacterium]|nr:beta-ketoacyl-[acyl-carrier-protein] synthase family protein [Spirochaetota bacterium]